MDFRRAASAIRSSSCFARLPNRRSVISASVLPVRSFGNRRFFFGA